MSSENIDTKPTIETVLERIDDFRRSVEARFDSLEKRVDNLDKRFDKRFESVEKRLDSLEKSTNVTRDDILALRLEIRDVRKQLEQLTPV